MRLTRIRLRHQIYTIAKGESMKIEIVEFYPTYISKDLNQASGTLHIYLPEEGIDIRGCRVRLKNNKGNFYAALPHGRQYDEEKKLQNYPMFSFFDDAKQQELKACLIEEAKKFMVVKIASMTPKQRKPHQRPSTKKYAPKTNAKGIPFKSSKPPKMQFNTIVQRSGYMTK